MKFVATFTAMPKIGRLSTKLILVMKLTTFIMIITFMQVSAKVFSQRVSLNERNVPIDNILKSIEKQTGYTFFFDDADLQQKRITIKVSNVSISEALEKSFSNLPLSFKIFDKDIVIIKKEESVLTRISKFLNLPINISGQVTDEKGTPLSGVNVKIKGTVNVIVTDESGHFNFSMPGDTKDLILVFSYTGLKTQEIKVTNSIELKVIMMLDVAKLDQVQIIGYGTSSQRYNTGSSAGIGSQTLEKIPVNDPILALQGRLPGLQVTSSSGLPGSGVNVQIRGINSLNRSSNNVGSVDVTNSPLYVVDGVPFISNPLNALGVSSNMGIYNANSSTIVQSSPFKSINPADIENIEVLKDADATAIYGARGANGVILITTKRPKAGKTTLDVDSYIGIGRIPKFINMLNTQQYLAVRKEAFKNDGGTPSSDPNDFAYAPELTVWDQNAYTDWQKKYSGETSLLTNTQATLSGGNEQTRFLFNTGYRNQGNVFPGDYGLKQGSFRLSVDHNSTDQKFTINLSAMYSTDLNKSLNADPYSYYNLPPNFPLYNPDGSLLFYYGVNPEAAYLQTYQDKTKNLSSNVLLGYQIAKGLNFKVSLGYNQIQQDQLKKNPLASFAPNSGSAATRDQATNTSSTYIVEPQLNYATEIGAGNLQVLLGGTYQGTNTSLLFLNGQGYTNDDLLGDLASAATITTTTNESEYKYLSVFGRLNYNWKGKYIINATGRRDGSSRFGPGRRFGNFGAVGAAWIFSQENWMKNLTFLSFGKFRGSYGITGNDKIGDYQFYDTYQANSLTPYQTVGYAPNKLFNPDYQWEITKKLEVAVELGFLKERILLTADYYRNRTGNSLISYPLPTQTGFGSVTQNLDANIQNSGFEFSLNTTNIKKNNFVWTTNFNISLQRNKLLSFPGLEGSPYSNQYAIGQSISNTHGFVYDGVDPNTGAAKIKDLNGNGIPLEFPQGTNPGDQTIIANNLPSFYGGFTNSFTYKNWQLDIFFNFRKFDKVPYNVNPFPGSSNNIDHSTGSRWQNPGEITNIPRYATLIFNPTTFEVNDALNNYIYLSSSDYTLKNGSYMRLSNAALSYNLLNAWVKQIKLKSVRVYMSAQNLFTISNFPGPDPETGLSMPQLRILTAGVKVSL